MSESGRDGACSVLRGGACSAQVPTVEEGEVVTLYIVFPFGMTQKNTLPKNKN